MEVNTLKVRGYRRFGLNPQLKQFTYTPTSDLQLVLGSNEAGKSTLFSLLIPSVVEHTDLSSDGYIILEVAHQGSYYTIALHKSPKITYSFSKDSKELNKSGKQTEQKSLIESVFALDKDAYNIIINELKFTSMPSSLRKKVLMNLSSFDFGFAMELYNRVNVRKRELNAISKHIAKRLLSETEKEISEEEYTDIENRKKSLEVKIETLKETVAKFDLFKAHPSSEFNPSKILSNVSLLNSFSIGLGIDLKNIDKSREKTISIIARENTLVEEYNAKLDKSVKLDVGNIDIESLNEKSEMVQSAINSQNHIDLNVYGITEENIESTIRHLESIFENVETILLDLDSDPEHKYSSAHLTVLRTDLESIETDIDKLESVRHRTSIALETLEHLKSHDSSTCPNCNTEFYKTYDRQEHGKQKSTMRDVTEKLNTLKEIRDGLLVEFEYEEIYISSLSTLNSLVSTHPQVNEIFKCLGAKKYIRTSPQSEAINFIKKAMRDINNKIVFYDLKRKLEETDKEISYYKEMKNQRESMDILSYDDLENMILTHTNRRITAVDRLTSLDTMLSLRDEVESALTHSRDTKRVEKDVLTVNFQREIANLAKEEIKMLSLEVNKVDLILSTYSSLEVVVKDLEEELKSVRQREAEYKDVVEQLSPVKGLIAHALDGSIGNIVNNLNLFLSRLWSSKFILSKPDVSKGNTYRFPVNTLSGNTDDIALVSDGMEDVINLAFKLVFMKAKGFENFPLLLDEYGRALDSTNRIKGYEYILNHISAMNFSTVFIISHYSSLYSMFSNKDAEFTILDDTNVDLSMVVNTLNTALRLE